MMTKREDSYHHGDLRTALIETAVEMIAAAGVESVTMRALSQRIGVSRTAPYRHFADKSALLAAVAEDGFTRLLQRLQEESLQAEADPLVRLRQMGVAYVLFAVDHPAHYRLMFSSTPTAPKTYLALAAAGNAVFAALVSAIRQCQEAHAIKADDPRQLANVAWATVHGLSSLLIDGQLPHVLDAQTAANYTTQTLIDGLALGTTSS